MNGVDRRSILDKFPGPERRVGVAVVGAGVAGVAAAIEAARAGADVLLVDEHPVDNDMMAMDVPLCFGQRMGEVVRNRAAMLARVVEANEGLAAAHDAGVDVQLGTYVWGAFVNGPAVQSLDGNVLGLADDRRSWLVGYDRLIVAAGARDVVLGFSGWERAGLVGVNGAWSLMSRYQAFAARRMVIVGSGPLALRTATLALDRGVEVAGIVEVGDRVRGDAAIAEALVRRGVPFFTSHTVREARGRVGEIESVVVVRVDGDLQPVRDSGREIACDTVCLAVGLVPSVELLDLVGARFAFRGSLGGWVPEIDGWMRTSARGVFAAGDGAGFHEGMAADPEIARGQGCRAGLAAAWSLGLITQDEAARRGAGHAPDTPPAGEVHASWHAWLRSLIHAGGLGVNVCQCEEVTRRELIEVKPPRYLRWDSAQMRGRNLATLARDGAVNQDQIKRLTRAGMGPCQGRRCREQVALLLAQSAATTVDRIPLPSFRPPVRPLPLSVLWPTDETAAMREEWVSWFGIPTQFSPHWEAGMAIAEPTAQTKLILSDE